MLKIKDNVNLKVLKKYGFENTEGFSTLGRYNYVSRCHTYTYRILVNKGTRILSFNCTTNAVLDTLFELIRDGIVERIK